MFAMGEFEAAVESVVGVVAARKRASCVAAALFAGRRAGVCNCARNRHALLREGGAPWPYDGRITSLARIPVPPRTAAYLRQAPHFSNY